MNYLVINDTQLLPPIIINYLYEWNAKNAEKKGEDCCDGKLAVVNSIFQSSTKKLSNRIHSCFMERCQFLGL